MSNKSLGKPLTADLVFAKTKSDSLENIKNLNLWGNDLEDLQLIEKMPNLEVISLSVNRISSLKDFGKCPKLQELYLRKNNVPDIREIKYLLKLPHLKVLWLQDNPCAQIENYREIVIKHLPNLAKLDNLPVTPQERASSKSVNFSLTSSPDQQDYSKQEQPYQPRPQSNHSNLSEKHSQYASNHYEEKPPQSEDKWGKKNVPKRTQEHSAREQSINRNQNILMAVLSLMRELDSGSLEIVRREADKMLH